jgi:hypothetical protein
MGDPAYPLLPRLIKGYTETARLSPEEESFNVHLSSSRVCVEIAFGRLKARWRCLLKRLDVCTLYICTQRPNSLLYFAQHCGIQN